MEAHEKQLVHLLVSSGPDKGKMFFLSGKKEALIGRFFAADLRLEDPAVSQKHCVVRSAGAFVFIEDLNSRNGTRVNNEPIASRILDEDGQIKIGSTVIQLTWVATEREAPLSAVHSVAAPTLIEGINSAARRSSGSVTSFHEKVVDATITDAAQFQEYRAARSQLGKAVDGHLLLEAIGMGSMGVVFRAKNMKTREEIALELIAKNNFCSESLRLDFMKQVKLGLDIPNAVTVRTMGETADQIYLTTDLIRGRTIQSGVESGTKFAAGVAVETIVPVCKSLEAAHAAGIIHQDLKPGNILLIGENTPILLELGLDKKTAEGKAILKRDQWEERLAYMPPEATRELVLDERSNIYSLGAIMMFMFTGKPPFTAASALELSKAVRYQDIPALAKLRPDLPPALTAVVLRAMSREPAERYKNMPEFAAALKGAIA